MADGTWETVEKKPKKIKDEKQRGRDGGQNRARGGNQRSSAPRSGGGRGPSQSNAATEKGATGVSSSKGSGRSAQGDKEAPTAPADDDCHEETTGNLASKLAAISIEDHSSAPEPIPVAPPPPMLLPVCSAAQFHRLAAGHLRRYLDGGGSGGGSDKHAMQPRGLYNGASACFRNCMLQALLSLSPFIHVACGLIGDLLEGDASDAPVTPAPGSGTPPFDLQTRLPMWREVLLFVDAMRVVSRDRKPLGATAGVAAPAAANTATAAKEPSKEPASAVASAGTASTARPGKKGRKSQQQQKQEAQRQRCGLQLNTSAHAVVGQQYAAGGSSSGSGSGSAGAGAAYVAPDDYLGGLFRAFRLSVARKAAPYATVAVDSPAAPSSSSSSSLSSAAPAAATMPGTSEKPANNAGLSIDTRISTGATAAPPDQKPSSKTTATSWASTATGIGCGGGFFTPSNKQEDAMEFLTYLLDVLHEEANMTHMANTARAEEGAVHVHGLGDESSAYATPMTGGGSSAVSDGGDEAPDAEAHGEADDDLTYYDPLSNAKCSKSFSGSSMGDNAAASAMRSGLMIDSVDYFDPLSEPPVPGGASGEDDEGWTEVRAAPKTSSSVGRSLGLSGMHTKMEIDAASKLTTSRGVASSIVAQLFHGIFRSEVLYAQKRVNSVTFQAFHCITLDVDRTSIPPSSSAAESSLAAALAKKPTPKYLQAAYPGSPAVSIGRGVGGSKGAALPAGGGGAAATQPCTLEAALANYFKEEKINTSSGNAIDGTGDFIVKRLTFERLPSVLILQINRYEYDYKRNISVKLPRPVVYPLNLSLPAEFLSSDLQKQRHLAASRRECAAVAPSASSLIPAADNDNAGGAGAGAVEAADVRYTLTSVVCHHGNNASRGHYTSVCRDATTGQWRCFNDVKVSSITEEEALQAHSVAYVLFYCLDDSCPSAL